MVVQEQAACGDRKRACPIRVLSFARGAIKQNRRQVGPVLGGRGIHLDRARLTRWRRGGLRSITPPVQLGFDGHGWMPPAAEHTDPGLPHARLRQCHLHDRFWEAANSTSAEWSFCLATFESPIHFCWAASSAMYVTSMFLITFSQFRC